MSAALGRAFDGTLLLHSTRALEDPVSELLHADELASADEEGPAPKMEPPSSTALLALEALCDARGEAALLEDEDGLVQFRSAQLDLLFGAESPPVAQDPSGRDTLEQWLAGRCAHPEDFLRSQAVLRASESNAVPEPLVLLDGTTLYREYHCLRRGAARAHLFLFRRERSTARSSAQPQPRQDRFVATLVHELRTPLATVVGTHELMLQSAMPEALRQQVLVAWRAGEVLLQRMNEMLDQASLEAGTFTLHERDFDLLQVLNGVLQLGGNEAQRKGLRVTVCVERDVPVMLRGDAGRLQQILGNLLSNACKFTEEGGVLVYVYATARDAEVVLHFSVVDTGPGVEPAMREQLFRPFVQGRAGARRSLGSGLGLNITRQLVEQLRGRLWLESAYGPPGAAFRVEVPLQIAARGAVARPSVGILRQAPAMLRAPAASPTTSLGTQADPPAEAQKPAVLVVDDHAVNRNMLAQLVRGLGGVPTEAADGYEALTLLRDKRFALVLLDLQMPRLDGWETTAMLRADEAQRGLPRCLVVAVSAAVLGEARQRAVDAGVDAFLDKPVSARRLGALLEKVGGKPRSPARVDSGTMRRVTLTSGPDATLDPEPLRTLRGYDRTREGTMVREVTAVFLQDLGARLAALAAASTDGEQPSRRHQAHALAGACANIGARRASALAWWIEHEARLPDPRMRDGLLASLEDERAPLQAMLSVVLSEGDGA